MRSDTKLKRELDTIQNQLHTSCDMPEKSYHTSRPAPPPEPQFVGYQNRCAEERPARRLCLDSQRRYCYTRKSPVLGEVIVACWLARVSKHDAFVLQVDLSLSRKQRGVDATERTGLGLGNNSYSFSCSLLPSTPSCIATFDSGKACSWSEVPRPPTKTVQQTSIGRLSFAVIFRSEPRRWKAHDCTITEFQQMTAASTNIQPAAAAAVLLCGVMSYVVVSPPAHQR